MLAIKAILAYQLLIPVWGWLFIVALFVADRLVKKDPTNRAQSVLHLIVTYALKAGLGAMPFLGDALRMIDAQAPAATPVEPEPAKVPASSSLRLLPLFLAFAGLVSLSACATAPKVAYETLGAASNWVRVAAEELPPSCETILRAEIAASKDKAAYTASSSKTIAQCDTAKAALKTAAASIKLAYDGVHNLAAGVASPKDLTAWVRLALDLYSDLTGVLQPLGVRLPGLVN